MSKRISRRYVLRGAGVALALPWLESVAPTKRASAQTASVKRFMSIYMPNGASTLWWKTTGEGSGDNWQLSPLLSAFEPVKSKMLMVRQVGNFTWRDDLLTMNPGWTTTRERNDFCGVCSMPSGAFVVPSHSRDPSAMLTCVDGDAVRRRMGQNPDSGAGNAESFDQLIARSLPQEVPLQSMQVGILNGNGGLDGRNAALSRNMSWNQEGTPLGKEIEPKKVFDKLVASGAGQDGVDPAAVEAAERRRALDLSALDALEQSGTQLKSKLGQGDKDRLDSFLTGVRELEKTANSVLEADAACEVKEPPSNVSQNDVRARAMNDLIVMALQCDVTRVLTYMLDNSRSDLVYSWVPRRDWENNGAEVGGTSTSYHESQHHAGVSPDFASITRWHIENVADLLQKLDAVNEGEGTLLDHSVVTFMSGMHHGDHALFDLPFTMFGGAGTLRQNELIHLPEAIEDIVQLRDFYYTLANNYFDVPVESFGEDKRGQPNMPVSQILV